MGTRTLYQVGAIGTASGKLRKTTPVAQISESTDGCKWYVSSDKYGDTLGYVEKIAEGFAAYAIEEDRDGFHWQRTCDTLSAALRAVMGRPGYGYTHYSFRR